ncbi:MAG: UMP kinase [Acetilactobacillus jinshanensis]
MSNLKYNRIVLKISGEALAGDQGLGINPEVIKAITKKVKTAYETGIQIAIVVGGGNMWRGVTGAKLGMERSRADYIGMLATIMNSLALQDGLRAIGVPAFVQTSIPMRQLAEPYNLDTALNHLKKHQIVIFGGGIGNPYFSTDTTAVLRAAEIHADAILMAKNGVDGVYSADPNKDPKAVKYSHLHYVDLIKKDLKVMDTTASSLAMENHIPLIVFDFKAAHNITKIIKGASVGTLID